MQAHMHHNIIGTTTNHDSDRERKDNERETPVWSTKTSLRIPITSTLGKEVSHS